MSIPIITVISFICTDIFMITVDGGWGAWGEWSACSKTCGGATVTRVRKCDNPAPSNGGKPCEAKDAQETKTDCNQPCEGNRKLQAHKKLSLIFSHRSFFFSTLLFARVLGLQTKKENHKNKRTILNNNDFNPSLVGPLDGHWSDWSEWSPCAKSCGGSRVTRKRSCNNPSPQRGGEECPGEPTETAFDCETPCPGTYVKYIMGTCHVIRLQLFFRFK